MDQDKFADNVFAEAKRERRLKYIRLAVYTLMFAVYVYGARSMFLKDDADSGKKVKTELYSSEEFASNAGKPKAVVAVLPIDGIIYGSALNSDTKPSKSLLSGAMPDNMVVRVKEALAVLEKEKNLSSLVLYINSPGGTVLASDAIYTMVKEWKKKTHVPVVAYFDMVAASGGYYIAQSADTIVTNKESLTGSIGVILDVMNYSDLAKMFGVKADPIKTGAFKDMGSPLREMRPDERAVLQSLVSESFESFLAVVAEGRKGRLSMAEIRRLADGRIYSGRQAVRLKLADIAGTFDDVVNWQKNGANISGQYSGVDVLVYRKPEQSLFSGFLSQYSDPQKLSLFENQMHGPQLMYLWNGA